MTTLLTPKAPNLPMSPLLPDRRYLDDLTNAQRLYFNQLDAVNTAVLGPRGGKWLDFPYAAIQRTTDKTFTANTATEITFDQNDFVNGCENDGTNGILVQQSGIYNYQFSIQFANSDSQAHTAWNWLRVNSTDVLATGSQYSIPSRHGTTDGHIIAAANFYVQLAAGDYVKMYAAVDNVAVIMESYPAQTSPFVMPAIPSVVATLSFVSNTPA